MLIVIVSNVSCIRSLTEDADVANVANGMTTFQAAVLSCVFNVETRQRHIDLACVANAVRITITRQDAESSVLRVCCG